MCQVSRLKWLILAAGLVLIAVLLFVALSRNDACGDWQERFLRVGQSAGRPETVEKVRSERPEGCAYPSG